MAYNPGAADYGITEQQLAQARAMARLKTSQRSGWQGGLYYTPDSSAYNKALAAEIEKISGSNTGVGTGTQSNQASSSESASSSFSGLQDPEALAMVKGLLNQMNNGGTEAYKKAQAQKDAGIAGIDAALADYSKQSAFKDAADLIQQSLNKSMEANKPAIQKAVEGAGTSAGSMQALLSQKLATEASTAAGALGAEQAKAYGGISASLLNTRGGLTTGKDDSLDPLTKLLDLLKVSTSNSASKSSGNSMSNFNPMTNPYATTSFSTVGKASAGGVGNVGASDYGLGVDTGSNTFNPAAYFQ